MHTAGRPSAEPLVVESARKAFGTVRALDEVSFSVRQGELVGLLGPNGAGKTTLIKAVAGRVSLDSGTVHLFGRKLDDRDDRPELGVVPQELAIYPLLTARENLSTFGRLYGVPADRVATRVDWALEWADLRDRANEPVKRFSGGMKRRLNIACSLVHEPSVVLLDEPTVGVDPQSRERIYEMLSVLRSSGVSVVLTTHHLEEAQQRCERIVIIDHGRIVASGTVAELVDASARGSRRARVTLVAPLVPSAPLPEGVWLSADGLSLEAAVDDAANDVRRLIDAAASAGGQVQDVSLGSATLQDVFISLTGRDLRE